MKRVLFMILAMASISAIGQCPANQVEVTIQMFTDFYPEENYWQLTPNGAGCGNSVITEGANLDVGCAGNESEANGEEYLPNDTVLVGPMCLDSGSYDIIFVDSWGDGGMDFQVFEGSTLMNVYMGSGDGNVFTFTIGSSNLPQNDMPCNATLIYPDSLPVLMSNLASTSSIGEPAPMTLGCAIPGSWCENTVTNTVWAKFNPEANAAYLISTCDSLTDLDTQIALYRVSDCNDFSTFTLVHSNDDQTNGCMSGAMYASTLTTSCLDTAYTYYIQIDGYSGLQGNFALRIETSAVVFDTLEAYMTNILCPPSPGLIQTGAIMPYITDMGVDLHCSWTSSNGFESGENYIDSLLPGTYYLTAIDACNNTYNVEYVIAEPTPWTVEAISQGPACPESNDGAISIVAAGATAPYFMFWQGPNNFFEYTLDITDLDEGLYQGFLSDNFGCSYNLEVTLEPTLDLNPGLPDTTQICFGDELVLICGTLPADASIVWSDGSTGNTLAYPALSFPVTSQVDFSVTISTPQGCEETHDVIVLVDQSCVGVDELSSVDVSIFPNPSNGLFQVKSVKGGQFQVYNTQGKWMESFKLNANGSIALGQDWSAGLYMITNGEESIHLIKE
jgi:hypothetical protein